MSEAEPRQRVRVVPLRRRLFFLAAAGILPITILSGVGLLALAARQREQADRTGLEIARALLTGVDAEIGRSMAALETLSASPLLDSGELDAFQLSAEHVAMERKHWIAIRLADATGRVLIDTRFRRGAAPPPTVDTESFARVLEKKEPAIGPIRQRPGTPMAFAIRVPVLREGALRFVLSALVLPDSIRSVLERQRLPEDWVASVFDASGLRVARSRRHEEFLGQPASESLQRLMEQSGDEGVGITTALEGERVYTAYSRSRQTGWSVGLGIPLSFVQLGVRRSLLVYGGGVAASLALVGLAAFRAARRINEPIARLYAAARALGRGESPAAPEGDILEIREVGTALVAAGEQRSRSEAEREDLLVREQIARAAAEAASRAKDEFLAMLGHELRNPLGAIANAARLLERPDVKPETALHAREIIGRQVSHLARMTDDLLDAGRAITGKIVLHRVPLDLSAATASALATLQPRLERHPLERSLAPVWIHADATRVEQIVSNLIGNAIKFTPPGGRVRVDVRREGDDAVLRVADEGIGMTPDLAARAFDLFAQGDRELDRAHGGLGIGLTLVRRLAELHGGSVSATSAGPGRGSELVVRLPAIAPPAAAVADVPRAARRSAREILLVEDNEDVRETLRDLLEHDGHRVRVACDGAEGLEAALAAPPDVALIDIGLPKLDGYELARRFRAAHGADRTVLVALTGYGMPEDRARAREAGFDAHLVKPVDPEALARILAERDAAHPSA